MEVSQVYGKACLSSRWQAVTQFAATKAVLLIAGYIALQTCSLEAGEDATAAPVNAIASQSSTQANFLHEAAELHLTKAPREPSQPVAATRVAAATYQPAVAGALNFSRNLPAQQPIGQISIDIRPKSKAGSQTLPTDVAPQDSGDLPVVVATRIQPLSTISTSVQARGAEAFAYQPLYFEQANVERYGRYHSPLQPATSAMRFFATIPALPYAMAMHRPHTAYYWDWPYEAGWAAPRVRELPPFQPRAAVVESATLVGLAFLLP